MQVQGLVQGQEPEQVQEHEQEQVRHGQGQVILSWAWWRWLVEPVWWRGGKWTDWTGPSWPIMAALVTSRAFQVSSKHGEIPGYEARLNL